MPLNKMSDEKESYGKLYKLDELDHRPSRSTHCNSVDGSFDHGLSKFKSAIYDYKPGYLQMDPQINGFTHPNVNVYAAAEGVTDNSEFQGANFNASLTNIGNVPIRYEILTFDVFFDGSKAAGLKPTDTKTTAGNIPATVVSTVLVNKIS